MTETPPNLFYVTDTSRGIYRTGEAPDFRYISHDNNVVMSKRDLERINTLAIPPAYKDVWICEDPHGHLQATGIDDKERKQYIYHPDWRIFRDQIKYEKLFDFGKYLPTLRRRVRRDLRKNTIDKMFTCAALVRLLDRTAIRVGNREYASSANSFGATTLRERHVSFHKDGFTLRFAGKRGQTVKKSVSNRTLHQALEQISDLPGRELFQYFGSTGEIYALDSGDVNSYIGEQHTAKTFRTWHGTVAAIQQALQCDGSPTIKQMCEAAAKRLSNTPSICRSSYVHPAVIDLAKTENESRLDELRNLTVEPVRELRRDERVLQHYLSNAK